MNIDAFLAREAKLDPTFGDYGPDFENALHRANATTEAIAVWEMIANGTADVVQTLIWAQCIAKRIKIQVINKSERDAAPGALKALGFFGRRDRHRAAREALLSIACFEFEREDGRPLRMTSTDWANWLRDHGYLKGVKSKTAVNLVTEWLREEKKGLKQ